MISTLRPGKGFPPSLPYAFRLALALLALLVGSSGPLLAVGEPWLSRPFTAAVPDVVDAAAKFEAPAGAHVLVLYREGSVTFDAEGRTTYRQRLLYRLLTAKGVEGWSRVEVDYAPWHQERPRIRARVLTVEGREHRLDPSEVIESPVPSDSPDVIADRKMLRAPLLGVTVGAVVEEEVVVRDTEPFFAAGTAGSYPLRMFAPIHRGRFALIAPVTLPLRYGVRLMPDLAPRQKFADGRVELVFEYGDVPAIGRIEPGLPSHQPRLPQITFSTGESWQAVAAGYARLVEEKIAAAAAPELDALAGQLPSAGTLAERVGTILAELRREVRYTGLELGASSVVPASPEVTLRRGFGDCKDQATLLVALLRTAGIEAQLALLHAGLGKDIEPRLPGIGRFNHAVVYVASKPPLWVDPTDPFARVGELPGVNQNRWALIISPETEKLSRTPSANSIDNLTMEERVIHLADHGSGRIVERSTYHGEQERQQRRISRGSTDESRRQGYWEYVESTYLAEELGEVQESDPDDLAAPFTLTLEALGSGRAVTDLSEAVVAIRQDSLLASLPAAIQKGSRPREQPFVLDQPFITEWHYRILPPSGFVLRQIPADEERRWGTARYRRQIRQEEGEILVSFVFDSGPRYLTAADFNDMRRGVQAFLKEEPLLLWFDHEGAAALAEGRPAEAVERFRRLAEEEPGNAIHHIRFAQALVKVGLGREGQRQARRAVELAPSSALAHWSLGFAFEHDEIGRRFGAGFARDEAIAALERAVELEPDNPLPRTELAILLEYDSEGKRYASGADLDRAVTEYRTLRAELGAENLEVNLISTLYWARRWEDLYAATLEMHDTPVSRYLHLVALALLEGPDAAIRESESMSSSPEERLGLLNSATQHLVIGRFYSQAAALLRRVARGVTEGTDLLVRAEILERARKHEELEIKTETPALLARSLLVLLGRRSVEEKRFAELFHPRYLEERGYEDIALAATLKRMRQEQFQSAGELPVEAVIDLALAMLRTEVDGDARSGFRVRMLNEMDDSSVAFRIFVTPFEGRLTIAAVEDEYGQIGKEVWRRLDRGDLRGAHKWLDWARESLRRFQSSDPYGFKPFPRFWTRGTGAFRQKMHLAAALLMADQPEAADVVPVLEEALLEAEDEETRRVVEVALFIAYNRLERNRKLGELSARLLEREPASTLAFLGRAQQLLAEGRLPELTDLARERLVLLPQNLEALRFLVRGAMRRNDIEQALSYFAEIEATGKLHPNDDNLWSWLLLFEEPISEQALALAQRGATASNYRDRAMLHTLSTVYAELGRPAEAYQALLQSLELKEKGLPTNGDWYVLGRIAEEFGFSDLAREYYGKLNPPKKGETYTTLDLAARRLGALAARDKKRGGP